MPRRMLHTPLWRSCAVCEATGWVLFCRVGTDEARVPWHAAKRKRGGKASVTGPGDRHHSRSPLPACSNRCVRARWLGTRKRLPRPTSAYQSVQLRTPQASSGGKSATDVAIMRPPPRASRRAPVDSDREAARGETACRNSGRAPGAKRTRTPAARRAGAAAPPRASRGAATGEPAAPAAAATSREAEVSELYAFAVRLGRADLVAALLDAGVAPCGRAATMLLFVACADEPLRAPAVNFQEANGPVAFDASMRATMAALLARRAIRDEVLPGGGLRASGMLARRGLWDRALLLASGDRSGSHVSRTQARGTLLAVAAEHGAATPLAALLAALERGALLKLRGAQSASRRNAAARNACGLARTLCTHLLPLLTRPPQLAGTAPPRGERPHCVALVGATARRLRAAAGGAAVELLPPLTDLPDSDDDSSDTESDSESDEDNGEVGPRRALPQPAAALADILPGLEALFPAPAAAHDAGCAAVVASLAEGAPLVWSAAAHAACPVAFRAAMRAAACSLHAVGLPPELLQAVVRHAAEAQLWPGSSSGHHTPPPASLAELERR